MSAGEPDKDEEKTSDEGRRRIVSSSKRSPSKASDYWTKERMENSKAVPMPVPKPAELNDSNEIQSENENEVEDDASK